MKRFISGFVSISLLFLSIGPSPALAVITGTFSAVETISNVSAVNDQSAVSTTTVANVVAGADLTQEALWSNDVLNVAGTAASVTVDSDIVVTANALNSSGNSISIEVQQVDVDLGPCPNDATIGVERSGSIIIVYVQHNTNPHANCAASPVDVTRTSIAEALNIATTAPIQIQGDLVTATTTGDVHTLVTGSGGNPLAKAGTVPQTYLVGGLDGTAQVDSITIGGVIEEGDVFTAHLPGPVDASYVAQLGDDASDVADGLNTAILNSLDYAGQAFNAGVVANIITLVAKVAGVGFAVSSDATNRPAVAQVDTITLSGTVEEGDVYTAHLPGSNDASYTVLGSDTTLDDVAAGLNGAIQLSPGYVGFTSSATGNVITLTSDTPGVPFTVTTSTTNRTAIAQTVTFTPALVIVGETFRANINGSIYNYLAQTGDVVLDVVAALAPDMDANAAVVCTEDGSMITCTSSVAGTPFTFSSEVVDETSPTLTSVTLSSNNTNSAFAKVGDAVTLSFTASEAIELPIVSIASHSATPLYLGGNDYAASTTILISDTEGPTAFEIEFEDTNSNSGVNVTSTTDASSVTLDRTAPVIAAHADVTAEATSSAGVVVSYTAPDATDNIDVTASASCSLASASNFALGTTTVACNKSDSAGNTATTTNLNVIVVDTTAPSITAPADIVQEATGINNIVLLGSPIASDTVDGSVDVISDAPAFFTLGTTTVTWTATDDFGNTATDTQQVVITDTTAPVVTLNGGSFEFAWTSNGYTDPGSVVTDNHDVGLTAVVTGSVDHNTPGTYILTYTATDASGNSSFVTRTVGIGAPSGGGGGGSSSGGQVLGATTDVSVQIAALKAQIAILIQQMIELLKQQLAAAITAGN